MSLLQNPVSNSSRRALTFCLVQLHQMACTQLTLERESIRHTTLLPPVTDVSLRTFCNIEADGPEINLDNSDCVWTSSHSGSGLTNELQSLVPNTLLKRSSQFSPRVRDDVHLWKRERDAEVNGGEWRKLIEGVMCCRRKLKRLARSDREEKRREW